MFVCLIVNAEMLHADATRPQSLDFVYAWERVRVGDNILIP